MALSDVMDIVPDAGQGHERMTRCLCPSPVRYRFRPPKTFMGQFLPTYGTDGLSFCAKYHHT